jgi:uncharacterized peroxidase-related enzyme
MAAASIAWNRPPDRSGVGEHPDQRTDEHSDQQNRLTIDQKGVTVPHIPLNPELPGITGLFAFRPQTAEPMMALAEVLLRGESSLSRGERELIAAYVSGCNDCEFCTASHSAVAAAQLPEGMELVEAVRKDPDTAAVEPKIRALLKIAGSVAQGGRAVTDDQVVAARAEGATDLEIHDTVLIAAAFCMFNRYVDGLATAVPESPEGYLMAAERLVHQGYVMR